jgi:hypothetical protein
MQPLPACPFAVGDAVVFAPSARTLGLYRDIGRLGVKVGEVRTIVEIREGTYLYFEGGVGGWPWPEFQCAASGRSDA